VTWSDPNPSFTARLPNAFGSWLGRSAYQTSEPICWIFPHASNAWPLIMLLKSQISGDPTIEVRIRGSRDGTPCQAVGQGQTVYPVVNSLLDGISPPDEKGRGDHPGLSSLLRGESV
jgi:hypothetical protein